MRSLNQYMRQEPAVFVRIGLQELLLDLCCQLIAARLRVLKKDSHPETGLVGQVEAALGNPTEGGLLNALRWLIKQELHPGALALVEMIRGAKGSCEWLASAVELRNAEVHGKVNLSAFSDLLARAPDWDSCGSIDKKEGRLIWCSGDDAFELSPFFQVWDNKVVRVKQLTPPLAAVFEQEALSCRKEFAAYWQQVRIHDQQLNNPVAQDFILKAKNATDTPRPGARLPDRHLMCREAKQMIFLVENGVADAALRTEAFVGDRLVVDITPGTGATVAEELASELGLARPPSPGQLLEWMKEHPTIFVVRTHQLSSADLRKLFLWLADLREYGHPNEMLIIVEREISLTHHDQETIGDDLPPLHSLLCHAKKNPYETLPDYVIGASSLSVRKVLAR